MGSGLLPRRLRPHVAVFYALARAADDIADDASLQSDEKLFRLERLEQAVCGRITDDPTLSKAYAYRESAGRSRTPVRHMVDLIHAFKQDATRQRYRDWDDLMGYCGLSAAPVGRFLLDLHGEDPSNYRYSDPLCHALQVLNHLQDLREDYLSLDRIYLPGDWMNESGTAVEDLGRRTASPALQRVIEVCLDHCAGLLDEGRPLPHALRSSRLAAEADLTARLARRLLARLRTCDPLAERVALNRIDFLVCGVRSLVRLLS